MYGVGWCYAHTSRGVCEHETSSSVPSGVWSRNRDWRFNLNDFHFKISASFVSTIFAIWPSTRRAFPQNRSLPTEALEVVVMETSKRVLGEEHPETLTSITQSRGRWNDAETSKRVLGEEHPETLTSIANLASTYWNQGRWNDAEALEVARVLGVDPDLKVTISGLHGDVPGVAELRGSFNPPGR
ncbi:hypothetical protein B0H14DRAFT_2804494 [Mycena olivaceomarginata]|nr:hypothetical protein B0H14DRAFT_2804494 [Mycena olivaceomarginata]